MTRLKKLRLKKRMTLREVGSIVKASIQSVYTQEVRGIRTVKTAKRYAIVFGCDWRKLLDDEE